MAPPLNRRSGHSRRAQYTTFFGYLIGVVGVLVGAGLLMLTIFNPGVFSGFRTTASRAVEPAGATVARTRSGTRSFFEVVEGYLLSGERAAKMRRELEEAKVHLAESEALEEENGRLRKLLDLSEREPRPVTVTRITGSTATSTRRLATIGAGSADGVTVGMPVRSELGLIGRVLEVGRTSARVLLVTDTQSIVPVRRAADKIAAFAQGNGDGTLRLRLIDLGINPLKKGDTFVTSGSGGLYREGIAIAVVSELLRDGANALVIANPAATEFVLVDPVRAPEAQEPLEAEEGAER